MYWARECEGVTVKIWFFLSHIFIGHNLKQYASKIFLFEFLKLLKLELLYSYICKISMKENYIGSFEETIGIEAKLTVIVTVP